MNRRAFLFGTAALTAMAASGATFLPETACPTDFAARHPGFAKAWASISYSGGIIDSYNVARVERLGVGSLAIHFEKEFDDADYCVVAVDTPAVAAVERRSTKVAVVSTFALNGAPQEPDGVNVVVF